MFTGQRYTDTAMAYHATQPEQLKHTLAALATISTALCTTAVHLHPHSGALVQVAEHTRQLCAEQLPGCGPLLRHWSDPQEPLHQWLDSAGSSLAQTAGVKVPTGECYFVCDMHGRSLSIWLALT
jgi:hypothetical protein